MNRPIEWLILSLYRPVEWLILSVYRPVKWLILSMYRPIEWLLLSMYRPVEWLILSMFRPVEWLILSMYRPIEWLIFINISATEWLILSVYQDYQPYSQNQLHNPVNWNFHITSSGERIWVKHEYEGPGLWLRETLAESVGVASPVWLWQLSPPHGDLKKFNHSYFQLKTSSKGDRQTDRQTDTETKTKRQRKRGRDKIKFFIYDGNR